MEIALYTTSATTNIPAHIPVPTNPKTIPSQATMYILMVVAVKPSRPRPDWNTNAFSGTDLTSSGALLLGHEATLATSTTCMSLDVNHCCC